MFGANLTGKLRKEEDEEYKKKLAARKAEKEKLKAAGAGGGAETQNQPPSAAEVEQPAEKKAKAEAAPKKAAAEPKAEAAKPTETPAESKSPKAKPKVEKAPEAAKPEPKPEPAAVDSETTAVIKPKAKKEGGILKNSTATNKEPEAKQPAQATAVTTEQKVENTSTTITASAPKANASAGIIITETSTVTAKTGSSTKKASTKEKPEAKKEKKGETAAPAKKEDQVKETKKEVVSGTLSSDTDKGLSLLEEHKSVKKTTVTTVETKESIVSPSELEVNTLPAAEPPAKPGQLSPSPKTLKLDKQVTPEKETKPTAQVSPKATEVRIEEKLTKLQTTTETTLQSKMAAPAAVSPRKSEEEEEEEGPVQNPLADKGKMKLIAGEGEIQQGEPQLTSELTSATSETIVTTKTTRTETESVKSLNELSQDVIDQLATTMTANALRAAAGGGQEVATPVASFVVSKKATAKQGHGPERPPSPVAATLEKEGEGAGGAKVAPQKPKERPQQEVKPRPVPKKQVLPAGAELHALKPVKTSGESSWIQQETVTRAVSSAPWAGKPVQIQNVSDAAYLKQVAVADPSQAAAFPPAKPGEYYHEFLPVLPRPPPVLSPTPTQQQQYQQRNPLSPIQPQFGSTNVQQQLSIRTDVQGGPEGPGSRPSPGDTKVLWPPLQEATGALSPKRGLTPQRDETTMIRYQKSLSPRQAGEAGEFATRAGAKAIAVAWPPKAQPTEPQPANIDRAPWAKAFLKEGGGQWPPPRALTQEEEEEQRQREAGEELLIKGKVSNITKAWPPVREPSPEPLTVETECYFTEPVGEYTHEFEVSPRRPVVSIPHQYATSGARSQQKRSHGVATNVQQNSFSATYVPPAQGVGRSSAFNTVISKNISRQQQQQSQQYNQQAQQLPKLQPLTADMYAIGGGPELHGSVYRQPHYQSSYQPGYQQGYQSQQQPSSYGVQTYIPPQQPSVGFNVFEKSSLSSPAGRPQPPQQQQQQQQPFYESRPFYVPSATSPNPAAFSNFSYQASPGSTGYSTTTNYSYYPEIAAGFSPGGYSTTATATSTRPMEVTKRTYQRTYNKQEYQGGAPPQQPYQSSQPAQQGGWY